MNRMIEIEIRCSELEKETIEILNRNFPLDSRNYLLGEDAIKVANNDEEINQLSKEYLDIYKTLLFDEQRKHVYKNIKGSYYRNTHEPKGLIMVYPNSDENELHESFSRASYFGMIAIDNIRDNNKNTDEKLKSQRVFDECIAILKVHHWGESHIEDLKRYSQETSEFTENGPKLVK